MPRKKKEQVEYLPIASTAATHAISAIGSALSRDPLMLVYAGKKVEIYSISEAVTHLGFTTKRLFDFLLLRLTQYNSNKGDWTNASVTFKLRDYMHVMGYEDTRLMRYKCFERLKEDVTKLGTLQLRQEGAWWFGLVYRARFLKRNKITGVEDEQATKREIINGEASFEVSFQPDMLAHLRECRFIVPFLVRLFSRIQQNENAYSLAKRMVLHCCQDGNIDKVNRFRLKVSTLLEACPANISSDTGNIRRTFEKAMNHLMQPPDVCDPLLVWMYRYDDKRCTPAEIQSKRLPHDAWLDLVVEFEPLNLSEGMQPVERGELEAAYNRYLTASNT